MEILTLLIAIAAAMAAFELVGIPSGGDARERLPDPSCMRSDGGPF